MSPEIFDNFGPYDGHAVDVWALGPMLFLLIYGSYPWKKPFSYIDKEYTLFSDGHFYATAKDWERENPDMCISSDLKDLLQRMFFSDPKDRLSMSQLRNHPWILE